MCKPAEAKSVAAAAGDNVNTTAMEEDDFDDIPADAEVCARQQAGGDAVQCDHLRQVFVTKNALLCYEVHKNFAELSQGCGAAAEHRDTESLPLPERWQDVQPAQCPLFVTSRQFLQMLDASLPPPHIFERNPDYTVRRQVEGWHESSAIALIVDEEEGDGVQRLTTANAELDDVESVFEEMLRRPTAAKVQVEARRIVTYEIFVYELWPKMNKMVKLDCHPTLVWTEITTYIVGSVEALHSQTGYLSREDYKKIGRKRAPNFTGNRDKIYDLFEQYRYEKMRRSLFDEADVVFRLYTKLLDVTAGNGALDWVIHEIYVDETQDFSQAELCLLMRCCRRPNDMFFTGDTAQSIMRGIAFRFEDLKSLFYHMGQTMQAQGHTKAIQVSALLQSSSIQLPFVCVIIFPCYMLLASKYLLR
jgi:hypothetical protein